MHASIQNDEPINVTVINSGVIPKILINPGALEKPIVLNNSPWSLFVCLSGNNFVPTINIKNAQKYQLARDISGPKIKFETPKWIAPTPAARLDKITTAAACNVADLSCSTSSYNSGSILIALNILLIKYFNEAYFPRSENCCFWF